MKHTDVVDWRVWKAAQIATVQSQGPIQAMPGDHVYVVTGLQKSHFGDVSFITPSPVALALNIAIGGAKTATQRRSQLRPEPTETPGKGQWVTPQQLTDLYAYFEQCMIAATFSYQAVEAFSNQVIIEGLQGTMRLERRGDPVDWSAQEIERKCSTEEKVATVLPQITQIASPKGTKVWQDLMALKDIRDATIHLKSKDQYVRGRPDNQTLYFQLLNTEPGNFPGWAIGIIRHFSAPSNLNWLAGAESQL